MNYYAEKRKRDFAFYKIPLAFPICLQLVKKLPSLVKLGLNLRDFLWAGVFHIVVTLLLH